jgi:hypothetical protein
LNRIFDVYQNEKLSYLAYSAVGLVQGVMVGLVGDYERRHEDQMLERLSRQLLASVFLVVQMLVLAILVCPLAAIYVCGLLFSTGISIWRLVQHDYGGNKDGEANLKPAMDTLYSLALLQGLLFCYRFFFSLTKKGLANQVVTDCDGNKERAVVSRYLHETRIGCDKDPSFASGRNFITHAVDLMGSKSHDDILSAVNMLYTAICMGERRLKKARAGSKYSCTGRWQKIIMQNMMLKYLITPASSSPVLQKLLQTLDPLGAFDRDTRNECATIVSHLALDIHLEQFPGAIQNICTLIGSFEEYRLIEPYHRHRLLNKYVQDWDRQASRLMDPYLKRANEVVEDYQKLLLTGFRILWKTGSWQPTRITAQS